MSLDFGEIKQIWKGQIKIYLDHRYLNEMLPPMNTTAENLVYWIYKKMKEGINSRPKIVKGARVEFVRLYETPTSYAEFRLEWDK